MNWSNRSATEHRWSNEISNWEIKDGLAARVAELVNDGDVIGVGSGSTCFVAIQKIGDRVRREGLRCVAVTTSIEASLACTVAGIETTSLLAVRPNWSFDGADEVSPEGYFLKGRGGAMFREKILMVSSLKRYLLVDRSKLVDRLGQTFPVPVEVYPEALHHVESELPRLGATSVELRLGVRKDGPVITEAGNLILDATFSNIESTLERDIKAVPGVIESGLFIGYDVDLLVGDG